MSARQLGRLAQVSDDVILAIEKGKYPSCQQPLAVQLDAVLNTGGVFERAWPMVFGDADKKRRDADKRADTPEERSAEVTQGRILGRDVSPLLTGSPAPVDRRHFLAASSLAAFVPIDLVQLVSPSAPAQQPGTITPLDIEQVLGVASSISRWDNSYGGGGMVADISSRAMQWAAGLLYADCPDVLRPDLFAAVSRLGIAVGATAFDSYAHDDARRTWKFAADCSEEAGDWHLRAKTYSLLARQAVWVGEPDEGLTHAEKGLVRSDRLTATERAMLHTARARAFARMKNVKDTLAAVGQADEAFADRDTSEDPPWMAYYDESQHAGDTAHALFDLRSSPVRTRERLENGSGQQFKGTTPRLPGLERCPGPNWRP
ncbi:XRE family transcriptional regulator [Streptomyces sp. NPDC001970]